MALESTRWGGGGQFRPGVMISRMFFLEKCVVKVALVLCVGIWKRELTVISFFIHD